MNYADIKQYDIANGPGIRVSLFVSGCPHACQGCFNEEAWNFNYGKEFSGETIDQILEYLKPDHIAGLSLLGGEPLAPSNQLALLPLLQQVKMNYPQKTIWCFTGYVFDQEILQKQCEQNSYTMEVLSYLDILVDGRFEIEKKDISLRFKGSSNQRTILVKETLKQKKIIEWNPNTYPV